MIVVALSIVAGLLGGRIGASVRRPRLVPIGLALAIIALVLLRVTSGGELVVLIATLGGVGVGLALPPWRNEPVTLARHGRFVAGGGCALATALVLWVGATDPTVQWFGHVYTRGPRDERTVALTFDDGPDVTWTPAVADILKMYGVEGTFFAVGQAAEQHPEILRQLHEDGHLVANHAHRHNGVGWLNPRYPDLDRAQKVFRDKVGVCPALFRPPHGQRTPFMLRKVEQAGMHTVTWDVSAADWSDNNGPRVARKVLEQAQAGSIILLHDGLDGSTNADRSVLATALPQILDGLAQAKLTPVRLDVLLDLPAYLGNC